MLANQYSFQTQSNLQHHLSLNLQTNKEINHESMSTAFRFSERCCGDTLKNIYKKQSSVSGDALDFSSIQSDIEKINYKEVH